MQAITQMFREVYDYRELLLAMTYRDIRVKYKQAIMGILWVFFMPLMGVLAGMVVQIGLAYMRNKDVELGNLVSAMVRWLPWMLFTQILGTTAGGILGGMGLASRIYFPRQVIPLSSVLSVLFDFGISLCGVILIILVMPKSPAVASWNLLLLPVLMLINLMMALGLGLIFGSANVFLRDVKYILQVLLQFGVFFTPVLYFVDQFGPVGQLMLWNPVAPVLEAVAHIVLNGHIPAHLWPFLGYSTIIAVVLMVIGTVVFRRTEHLFAEVM